jgi:hypothetical protein
MTDTPMKRPWFQFHLSTIIVLTLVAGCCVYANVVSFHRPIWTALSTGDNYGPNWDRFTGQGRGYPICFDYDDMLAESGVFWWAIAADLFFTLVFLSALAFTVEWWVCRRFRFHLLTAVVMMLTASILQYLNMRPYSALEVDGKLICNGYGWPQQAYIDNYDGFFYEFFHRSERLRDQWDVEAMLCDGLTALILFVIVATICEKLVCRKPDHEKQEGVQ